MNSYILYPIARSNYAHVYSTEIARWRHAVETLSALLGLSEGKPPETGATVEVKEWISNCIPHFIMDVINDPWWA